MIDINNEHLGNPAPNEIQSYDEYVVFSGNSSSEEFTNYEINKGKGKKALALCGAFAALALTVNGGGESAAAESKAAITDFQLFASQNVIEYSLLIENPADEEITVVVKNNFTNRSEILSGEICNGKQTGLKAGMTYNVVVKLGDTVLAEKTVVTKEE